MSKKKILTVVGTRPEFIKLSETIKTKTSAITKKTGSMPSFFLSMRITK